MLKSLGDRSPLVPTIVVSMGQLVYLSVGKDRAFWKVAEAIELPFEAKVAYIR